MVCQLLQRGNRVKLLLSILLMMIIAASCSPERKSASYYQENKEEINELKSQYEMLYTRQPFSVGFTDRRYKYFVMEIITDTLRAIYNSDKRKNELAENIFRFRYDTATLRRLAARMRKIKCLWIGKREHYFGANREVFTCISFQSANRTFKENKYYVLVLADRKVDYPEAEEQIRKDKLVQIDSLVYFTTTNKYR